MIENLSPRRPVYGRDHAATHAPDERARRVQARREAEALFAPKLTVTEDPIASPAKPARVLPASQPDVPTDPGPMPAKAIPPAHAARIRTWLRYGMTIAQIAGVYGVDTDEIAKLIGEG
jgi:hypothetical protein